MHGVPCSARCARPVQLEQLVCRRRDALRVWVVVQLLPARTRVRRCKACPYIARSRRRCGAGRVLSLLARSRPRSGIAIEPLPARAGLPLARRSRVAPDRAVVVTLIELVAARGDGRLSGVVVERLPAGTAIRRCTASRCSARSGRRRGAGTAARPRPRSPPCWRCCPGAPIPGRTLRHTRCRCSARSSRPVALVERIGVELIQEVAARRPWADRRGDHPCTRIVVE